MEPCAASDIWRWSYQNKTKQNKIESLKWLKLENKTSIKVALLYNTPKQRWDMYRNAPSFQNRTVNAMELESVSSAQITGTCFFSYFSYECIWQGKCQYPVLIFKGFPGYILITASTKINHLAASAVSFIYWVTVQPAPFTAEESVMHHSVLGNWNRRIPWMDLTAQSPMDSEGQNSSWV